MHFHESNFVPFENSRDRLMLDSLENLMRVVGCENSSVVELRPRDSRRTRNRTKVMMATTSKMRPMTLPADPHPESRVEWFGGFGSIICAKVGQQAQVASFLPTSFLEFVTVRASLGCTPKEILLFANPTYGFEGRSEQ